MKRLIGLTALCAIAGIGCGDDDGPGMMDAGMDVVIVIDTGMPVDTGMRPDVPDTGTRPTTTIGTPCDPVRGCAGPGEMCYDEARFTNTTGGTGDPIDGDVPAEYEDGYTSTLFPGGYCSVPECDLDAADTSCGAGATCVNVGGADDPFGLCLANCEANSTDNSSCRDGYDCIPGENVCFVGCKEIADCRIERRESNGIEGIQTPMDCSASAATCGGSVTNFDRLVWLSDAEAGDLDCNTDTFRCEFSGTPGAEAGDPCETDYDCEANGRCLTGEDGEPGFCSKISCDVPGRDCAGDGECINREARIGVAVCVPGCTVGAGADQANPTTWLGNRGGCPEGQFCMWSGAAADTDNGFCFPGGNNNDVTAENVGATCTEDDTCWSPFGDGVCLTALLEDGDLPNGYCSVFDCGAPGRGGENSCGEGNLCVGLGSGTAPISLCFQGCETAADCSAGLGCTAITEGEDKVCFPGCQETADCRAGQTCVGASATELGACE